MAATTDPIIVVGGGLAGLAAAAFAARSGAPVTLFEKAGGPGGRAATQVRDGVALNQGPHALYRGGAGMAALRELGIEPRGSDPGVSGAHAVAGGALHALPGGPVSLLTTSLLPLGAKLEVARLLAGIGRLDAAAWDGMTVEAWLGRALRHAETRALLAALFRLSTYVNDPGRLAAGVAIRQLQTALRAGVLYLDDGWQQLVSALRSAAETAGARLVSGVRVTGLECAGGVRSVVLADGTRHPARAVVLAVDPAAALDLVGAATDPALAAFVRAAAPAEAACLDVVLSALPRPRSTFALGIDRPTYLSVHSAVARLAPEGKVLVQLAKYLPGGGASDAVRDERELEELLDLVQPGWRDRVVFRRFLPHMTVVEAGGEAASGGLAGRPPVASTARTGVLLAGDWVGGEGWLADASLASGRTAARAATVPAAGAEPAAA